MTYLPIGIIFLLFAVTKNVASVCTIYLSPDALSISRGSNPLIYIYKSDGTPVIRYPSDSNCIFESEDRQIHLACTGLDNEVQFYDLRPNSAPLDIPANSSFVRLLHGLSDNDVVIVSNRKKVSYSLSYSESLIRCAEKPVAAMHLLSVERVTSLKGYVVGYRLNDVDFLKVYEQVYKNKDWIVTRYKINPSIQFRPAFSNNKEFKKGLFYEKKDINFHDLYSVTNQIANFLNTFESSKSTTSYFKENNLLVMEQLMFDEDTFYESDSISTHFYENTAPIWKSIYNGNWRAIGALIKKIAVESARELEVHACAWPSYQSGSSADWALGNVSFSSDVIPVPDLLIKAAIDVDNPDRSIVFHTFNDPYLDLNLAADKVQDYCQETTDCQELHPEFQNSFAGYTFCCKPKYSQIFMMINNY